MAEERREIHDVTLGKPEREAGGGDEAPGNADADALVLTAAAILDLPNAKVRAGDVL